jgi:hypothetical protein
MRAWSAWDAYRTASLPNLDFYRAVGFTDCGVAETDFGAAPRMVLALS